MTDRSDLNAVIGGLYDAALEPVRWPQALRRLAEFFASLGVYIMLVDNATHEIPFQVAYGVADEIQLAYAEYYRTVCPRIGYQVANPDVPVLYDYLHSTEAEMDRNEFYSDLLPQGDMRYYMATKVYGDDRLYAMVTIQRTREQGHVQQDDLDTLLLLRGHLRRALQLTRKLAETDMRSAVAADFVNALNTGVALLDRRGGVVFMNRKAEEVVTRGDGVTVGPRGFAARRASDDTVLQRLIAGALAVAGGAAIQGGGDMHLLRPDSDRPYTVTVSPLGRAVPVFGAEPPAVAIMIGDPDAAPELPAAWLQRLWGLTAREAEIALLIGAGRTPAEIAESFASSVRTVQAHLHHIFAKTGTSRQADLVRLVLTTPTPPRNPIG